MFFSSADHVANQSFTRDAAHTFSRLQLYIIAGRERREERPETGRKEEERWKRRSLPPGKVQQGSFTSFYYFILWLIESAGDGQDPKFESRSMCAIT
jgi:hypothetical protein